MVDDPSPEEERILNTHFEYLQRAHREGELILAGPCEDGAFGIAVFRAETPTAALDFMSNDPAVKGQVMTAELRPLRISLMEQT